MGPVMGTVILAMDGEEHRRYRNLVAHAFRPSALARWESELIGPTIHRLIDGLAGRTNRADLVAEITSHFPVQVIAGVLGVPADGPRPVPRLGSRHEQGPGRLPGVHGRLAAMRPTSRPSWRTASPSPPTI